jgi:hypothetical protein
LRVVVEQQGDPFAHLKEITDIWRELNAISGTRGEIDRWLADIETRLERLPDDGLRKATGRLLESVRAKNSGEEEF